MIKTHHGIDSLDRGGIEYPNLAAPVSMWTIPSESQGQLRASGDTFYQRGIDGWHEVAWYEFIVDEEGDYEFSFDYDIPVLKLWGSNYDVRQFGIFIAPSQPSSGNPAEQYFYQNKSGGAFVNLIGRPVACSNGNDLSGSVYNVVHLTAGHWWLWYPGAISDDGVNYTFAFSNIVVRKTYDIVRIPSAYTRLEYIHNDSNSSSILAQISPILNTGVEFGAYFWRDYDDYQQERSSGYVFGFKPNGSFDSSLGDRCFVRVYNGYTNVDNFDAFNSGTTFRISTYFDKNATRVKGRAILINDTLYYLINDRVAGGKAKIESYAPATFNYCNLFGAMRYRTNTQEVYECLIGRLYEVYARIGKNYLVRFIPVKRKSDNVLGFYELVSGQFFTDMNFQENFTAGPEVT